MQRAERKRDRADWIDRDQQHEEVAKDLLQHAGHRLYSSRRCPPPPPSASSSPTSTASGHGKIVYACSGYRRIHNACLLNGSPVVLARYDQDKGRWKTNATCFRLPEYLKERDASALWAAGRDWMGHRIESSTAVRYSALFPAFEVDAMSTMIAREGVGVDGVPDLILMNYKCADFVGHKYGPDSDELRATLREMDVQLGWLLTALERQVGDSYLLAVTADHGMPSEPPSPNRRHFVPDIVDLLHQRFDPQAKELITSFEPENGQIFVDEDRLAQLGLTLRDLARGIPGISALYLCGLHKR